LGVSIGFLILATLIRALPFRRIQPAVTTLSASIFLLVGFQGWLGSRVVASELKPILISAHMLVAFLIVSLLIYTVSLAARPWLEKQHLGPLTPRWRNVLSAAIVLTLIQIAMGTQIREAIDGITNTHAIVDRAIWRDHFPIIFYVHRSFSSLILFTNLWLAWKLRAATKAGNPLRLPAYFLAALVTIAVLSGVSLDRLGFPAVVQPLHLLMANLIFGTQFFIWIASRRIEKARNNPN
jgi:cytochrome c oxidase assembly protein subunit 15